MHNVFITSDDLTRKSLTVFRQTENIYSSVFMSVNVYVHVSKLTCHFDLPQSPTLTELFQPSMTGSNNAHEITWLLSQLPPPSCYFADHCKLKQALSFTEADCLQVLWNDTFLQYQRVFHAFKKHIHFIQNKLSCFLCFLMLFCIFNTDIL